MKISCELISTLHDIDTFCKDALTQLKNKIHKNDQFAAELLLRESLNNAIEHGNKFDPNLKITCKINLTEKEIEISVTDQGPGFNWAKGIKTKKLDKDATSSTSGRGLTICTKYASSVTFNKSGNTIVLKRILRKTGENKNGPT